VPLFFLISGYFLFLKKTDFRRLFGKKLRSLFLPYTLWHLIALGFYLAASLVPPLARLFQDTISTIQAWGPLDWLDAFVGKFTERAPYPFVYQFWFLRDLFVLCLLSPLIRIAVDRAPLLFLGLTGLLWMNRTQIYVASPEALLFFALGYYVVKYKAFFSALSRRGLAEVSLLYGIFILLELFWQKEFVLIHHLSELAGILFFYRLSWHLATHDRLFRLLAWLEGYAFFVYAFHEPLLGRLKTLLLRFIPLTDATVAFIYFGLVFITIGIALAVGIVVRKLLPRLYGLLTGGRA
jgi:surface polysaccharide O-acyltransferase-like enzyme